MSAEKKIKTNIQNSTLNSSFAALLKWHDPHIRQENEELLEISKKQTEELKNINKETEDIKQKTKEKIEELNRLRRKRRLDSLRPRTTPKKYKFWSWRTELKWISNKNSNFLNSYPVFYLFQYWLVSDYAFPCLICEIKFVINYTSSEENHFPSG